MSALARLVRETIVRLPGCVLLLMAGAFTLAFLCDRPYAYQAPVLAALLLPVLLLVVQPSARISDGLFARWLMLALLLLAWMAGVQALRADALPAGWLRFAERGAALACCLTVALGRVPVREMIALMGASATLVTVIALVMDTFSGRLGPLNIASFGFGQLNILTDSAGPALIAWAALIAGDAALHRRVRLRDLALLLVGLAAMALIAVASHRRGVVVAAGAAGLWPAGQWLYRRHRRLALAAIAAGALALAALLVQLLSMELPGLRFERISLMRVAGAGVEAGLPFGLGHFGMLRTLQLDGEDCRHFAACGGWVQHAHNEFLDVALDGGPVALALVLALVALTVWRLLLIRDAQVRLALQLMGIAITVHQLTDNVFGLAPTELWLGAAVGMIFSAPVAGAQPAPLTVLPAVRALAVPFTLLASWGALCTFPAVLLGRQAGVEQRLRCLEASRDPLIIDMVACDLIGGSAAELGPLRARVAIAHAVQQIGWNGQFAAIAAQQLPADDPHQAAGDLLRLLAFSPFYRQAYQDLGTLLHRHPECAMGVPAPVLRRLRYLEGGAQLAAPDLGAALAGIDDAADAYAGISWAIATGRSWAQISPALERLCRRYGDIPGVTQLVLQAALAAPAGSFPWLAAAVPALEVGVRFGFDALSFFSAVTTADQARALLPVVEAFYPGVVRDVSAGRLSEATASPELRNALVRLLALAGTRPLR
jgi:hypothetical protein